MSKHSMNKTRILVVTGTRAEYGLLQPVMRLIQADPALELLLCATGMHLSPEFGLTYRQIEADGFAIDEKIEMLLSSDTPVGIAKATGLATISFAEMLERHQPDWVMLLGDRFELLAAAQAALFCRVPIIHISGGDTTEGAMDEAIRHSITKMAHLHCTTNALATERVTQLGEDPAHIITTGNPGLDHLREMTLLSKAELGTQLGFDFRKRNLMVTFHPVTLDDEPAEKPFAELLAALEQTMGQDDTGILFTLPNADSFGRVIIKQIEAFCEEHPQAKAYASLGQLRYLSAIAAVDAVVGNSSSGLLEVPSLNTATVNIGDRQKGRIEAESVITVPAERTAIAHAIAKAYQLDCSGVANPYGDGHSAKRIVDAIKQVKNPKALIKKHFHDYTLSPKENPLPQGGGGEPTVSRVRAENRR